MIPIDLKDYEIIEYKYYNGLRYVAIIRTEYEHYWKLTIVSVRNMADAFRLRLDLKFDSIIAIAEKDLLTGQVGKFVEEQINEAVSIEDLVYF